jgi:hypothetical protein
MMMEQLTQALAQVDQIFPSNAAAGTYNSSGIDMQKFHRAQWVIEIGAMTASSTVNITIQTAANANFNANVHNMTTNVNIAQVPNTTNNVVVTLETTADSVVQQNPGDRYARVSVVVGTAAVNFSVVGYGGEANHKPASLQNPAAVNAQYLTSP